MTTTATKAKLLTIHITGVCYLLLVVIAWFLKECMEAYKLAKTYLDTAKKHMQ